MTRPLRIDVEGGWYHVTARGTERRTIFPDETYCVHFLELLERMSERYGVEVHAYCLMGNHYHLLLRTPEANASAAVQWLNVSHSVWFNRKRERVGHVFQGRFKSVLIDGDGSWLLIASAYLHLNPVRVEALGLGKAANAAERLGLAPLDRGQIETRLKTLRDYRWSSYLVYAGYMKKPDWLVTQALWRRAGGREKYRNYVQGYVTRGVDPSEFDEVRDRIAVGARDFIERMKRKVGLVSVEQPDRKFVVSTVSFDTIVKLVEQERGMSWEGLLRRRRDWARDMVLSLARRRSGLTLREVGERAGGMDYRAVGKAVERFESKIAGDKRLRGISNKLLRAMANVKT